MQQHSSTGSKSRSSCSCLFLPCTDDARCHELGNRVPEPLITSHGLFCLHGVLLQLPQKVTDLGVLEDSLYFGIGHGVADLLLIDLIAPLRLHDLAQDLLTAL